jgi:hypothetical protein
MVLLFLLVATGLLAGSILAFALRTGDAFDRLGAPLLEPEYEGLHPCPVKGKFMRAAWRKVVHVARVLGTRGRERPRRNSREAEVARRVSIGEPEPEPLAESDQLLPACAQDFLGEWQQVRIEHYGDYLRDVIGLSLILRKIAEAIPLSSTVVVEDGALHMRMACPGAKPVTEWMGMGEGEFHEPNQGLVYTVNARWEGGTFIAARKHKDVNGGREIVATRWIEPDGTLVTKQDWGGSQPYTQYCVRRRNSRTSK